jgi:hypothetical protein
MATGDMKRPSEGKGSATERPAAGGKDALSDVQPAQKNVGPVSETEHEGATEAQVGERGGPGVGFDQEPEREKDEGGVS